MYKIYDVDENYFEVIDTEEKAYWLGFIFADGCIGNDRTLIIELSTQDLCHLEMFKTAIKTTSPITFPKNKNSCRLRICNKKIVNDLIKLGCTPRKSLTLKYPLTLRQELDVSFVRGYFDGDGCISKSTVRDARKDKGNKKYYRDVWTFKLCGTFDFLTEVVRRLNLPVNRIITDGSKTYQLKYSGTYKPYNVIKTLYSNSNIHMQRKFDKYIVLENEIKNKTTNKL